MIRRVKSNRVSFLCGILEPPRNIFILDKSSLFFMIDVGNFKRFYKTASSKWSNGDTKLYEYLLDKGDLLIRLINNANSLGFIKENSKEEYEKIELNLKRTLENFKHVKKPVLMYFDLLKNAQQEKEDTLVLIDNKAGKIEITAQQIATMIGWCYATLCEIMRQYFLEILDFDKINANGRSKVPTGIGAVISSLDSKGIPVEFFKDIDSKVRNSFFHFDFEFRGDLIYCENKPEKYINNPWRTEADNLQSDYIRLADLHTLMLNADRSMLPLMCFLVYKNESSNN